MSQLCSPRLLAAALVVAAALGAPSPARADFQLAFQEAGVNGGALTVVPALVQAGPNPGETTLVASGTYGDFNYSFTIAYTNTPGTSALANVQVTNSLITNKDSGNSHTIDVWVSASDFTAPNSPPPVVLTGSNSGTIANTGTVSGTFTHSVDPGNVLFGTALSFASTITSLSGTNISWPTATGGQDVASGPLNLSGPYSLTSHASYTLGGGTQIKTNASTSITPSAVPEPSSIALLGTALVGFSGASFWRRRNGRVVVA